MRTCKRGHTVEGSECRECRNLRGRKYYHKVRAAFLKSQGLDGKNPTVLVEVRVHPDDREALEDFVESLKVARSFDNV